ncbi:Phosphatidylserine/phosphatidylglycerophosphate/cardiolipin synthase [Kushneria avicenniae]|uniref:Phosphatidylserine/phosphatidylglycerophosphate/cardiolipin synthase n=1 Tax=Kushneria avicenniae TaxID=402385 RepID=A0A1I1KID8_9GAMM|nr:phospholipase D-like domain-containing protein [Kushneria avicenniae]SFC60636.1 Phosphatidylserine/phosphatidylglycerophosphate/cardiolipin synthase [Kushneria avicenniae]
MREQWHDGNHFSLLPRAERFVPALLNAIDQAEASILIELYIVEDGEMAERFFTALESAVARGVDVRLLIDACGSWSLSGESKQRLADAGVSLREFNVLSLRHLGRFISRDHRKLIVIDGHTAFTGGFGISDQFLRSWFEVAVRITGPCVDDWIRLFNRAWRSRKAQDFVTGARKTNSVPVITPHSMRCEGSMVGRLVWGQGYRYQAIRRSLQHQVGTARERIWICTPYFVPTRTLRRQLRRAARRGVDVRLLLAARDHDHPSVRYAGQRFFTRLLRAGVRIFEFQPRFIHAKFSLCDGWSTIGSCNFDHWSLQWNLEANQEIDDDDFATELGTLFEHCFEQCHEISAARWASRSRRQRLREWGYGVMDALITRLR